MNHHPFPKKSTRRRFLMQTAAGLGLASASGCVPYEKRKTIPIKVGVLYSQTGNTALSESNARDATLLALDEINANGGVLGRKVEGVFEDPQSRPELYAKYIRKMLTKDKVVAIFGCWTSASRIAARPVVESLNGLLFYPLQYEGNESSPNIIYSGATANQQFIPALDWLISEAGGAHKRFYLIGSNYIYPQTIHFLLKKYLSSKSMTVAGEALIPLDELDYNAPVKAIQASEPDCIISNVVGMGSLNFIKEWAATNISTERVTMVSGTANETELQQTPQANLKGHLALWSYFQTINNPSNLVFINRFKEEFWSECVVSDPLVTAYSQVMLWKLAVDKAQSTDLTKVRDAFRTGISFDNAPGVPLRIDPKTQHAYRYCMIGRIRKDRQFDIVFQSPEPIAPEPYPAFAFPGWKCDWTSTGLIKGPNVDLTQ